MPSLGNDDTLLQPQQQYRGFFKDNMSGGDTKLKGHGGGSHGWGSHEGLAVRIRRRAKKWKNRTEQT